MPPEKKRDASLEEAIRREVESDQFSYAYNRVNLSNGAQPEALVYLPGPDFCGSGGCTSLVFAARDGGYRLVSRISLTRVPVIVSSHATNGWRDLIMFVSGGGIGHGYYVVLPFDGNKYPENPTDKPATPLQTRVTATAYLAGANRAQADIVVSPAH